ncbi:RDD family protein [Microbacterium aurum]
MSAAPDLARRPALLGRRIGAYLIDGAVALVVLLVAAAVLGGISFGTEGGFPLIAASIGAYAVAIGWFLVSSLMQGGGGSIGMRALGLRLVREADDAPLGFGRALLRNVIWGLGSAIIVGMFSPLFDPTPWRRGWHDQVSGAVMTDIAGHGAAVAAPATTASGAETTTDAGDTPRTGIPGPLGAPASYPAPYPAPAIAADAAAEPDERTVISPATAAAAPPAGVISFVPGVTSPGRPAAVPGAAVPGAAGSGAAGSVVPTVSAPAATPPAAPVPPAPAPASARHPSVLPDLVDQTRLSTGEKVLARLAWDDGATQAVYGRTLFGRNPVPETGAMVCPIRDETLSLSKTHFELLPAPDGDVDPALWVIDRHSTNGVVVRRGAERRPAVPGEPTRVRMGDVLEFGDRQVRIEVAP